MIGRSLSGIRRGRSLFLFVDVIFDLTLNVILGIFEFADTASKTTHQFGNFLATKQQKHYECDQY